MTTIRITRTVHLVICHQSCSGRNVRQLKHTGGTGIQDQDRKPLRSIIVRIRTTSILNGVIVNLRLQ